jgi:hypothetical protein
VLRADLLHECAGRVLYCDMLLLPPPLSARTRLVANARRRGIAITIIARGLGVSKQAVDQIVSKFEKYHGSISSPLKTHLRKRAAVRYVTCPSCGTRFRKRTDEKMTLYCSMECMGKENRLLTVEEISWAIEQRTTSGQAWTSLAQILGTDMQTVQSNIWLHLIDANNLTKDVVEKIWRGDQPRRGRPGDWNWLVNRTGVSPVERREFP